MWLSSTGKKWISVFVSIRSVFQNTVTYDDDDPVVMLKLLGVFDTVAVFAHNVAKTA